MKINSAEIVNLAVSGSNKATAISDGLKIPDGKLETNTATPIDLSVDCGTEKTIKLSQVVWDDLRAPATSINPAGLPAPPTFNTTKIGWGFSASATNVVAVILQLPHTYKEGTNITPHVHWFPQNTNTGNVLWRLSYKWTNINSVDSGSFTAIDVLSAGAGVVDTHQIAVFPTISGTGKTISSIFTCTLSRIGGDGTDTHTGVALLREFDIHFQIDTIGSRQAVIK